VLVAPASALAPVVGAVPPVGRAASAQWPDPLAQVDGLMRNVAWRASLLADARIAHLVRAADADISTPCDTPTAFWDNRRLLRVPTHAARASAIATKTPIDRTRALVLVPADRRLEVFAAYHHGDFGGHYAADTTLRCLMTTFYWHGVRRDVARWCDECPRCAVSRHHRAHGGAGLADGVENHGKLRCVAIDLFEMPTTPDGFTYGLVMVDHCTRFVAVEPLRDKTAASTASAFRRRWLLVFGVPWIVVSDNGSEFQGDEWRALALSYGFERTYSAPYNPQGNSIAERAVQEVKNRLARVVEQQDGTDWVRNIERACAAINTEIGSRGYSSFELLYGQQMMTPAAARINAESLVIRGAPRQVTHTTAQRTKELIALVNTRRAARQLYDHRRRNAKAPAQPLAIGDVVGRASHDSNASKFGLLARAVPGPYIIVGKSPYSNDKYGAFQLERPDGSLLTDQYIPARQLVLWKGDPWSPSPAAIAAEPGAHPWLGITDRSLLGTQLTNASASHDAALAHDNADTQALIDRMAAADARIVADITAAQHRMTDDSDADVVRSTRAVDTEAAIDNFLNHDTRIDPSTVIVHTDSLPFPVPHVLGRQHARTSRQSPLCIVEFNDSGKSRAIVNESLVDPNLIKAYTSRARSRRARQQ
jgi:transposase InsO family protein